MGGGKNKKDNKFFSSIEEQHPGEAKAAELAFLSNVSCHHLRIFFTNHHFLPCETTQKSSAIFISSTSQPEPPLLTTSFIIHHHPLNTSSSCPHEPRIKIVFNIFHRTINVIFTSLSLSANHQSHPFTTLLPNSRTLIPTDHSRRSSQLSILSPVSASPAIPTPPPILSVQPSSKPHHLVTHHRNHRTIPIHPRQLDSLHHFLHAPCTSHIIPAPSDRWSPTSHRLSYCFNRFFFPRRRCLRFCPCQELEENVKRVGAVAVIWNTLFSVQNSLASSLPLLHHRRLLPALLLPEEPL